MTTHSGKGSDFKWNPKVLEVHLAQGIASFSEAIIPDLSDEFPQAEHWIGNHFLNTVLRKRYNEPFKQFALNFISRIQLAFKAYHDSRQATLYYIEEFSPDNPSPSRYAAAIASWEFFLINMWIGFQFQRKIIGGHIFEPKKNSPLEHTYELANDVKHWPSEEQITGGDTIPVWLTNEGLKSKKYHASFIQIADILRETAELAELMTDPIRLEKIAKTKIS